MQREVESQLQDPCWHTHAPTAPKSVIKIKPRNVRNTCDKKWEKRRRSFCLAVIAVYYSRIPLIYYFLLVEDMDPSHELPRLPLPLRAPPEVQITLRSKE